MADFRIEPLATHPVYEKIRDLDKGAGPVVYVAAEAHVTHCDTP
jgi:hypothetical protein